MVLGLKPPPPPPPPPPRGCPPPTPPPPPAPHTLWCTPSERPLAHKPWADESAANRPEGIYSRCKAQTIFLQIISIYRKKRKKMETIFPFSRAWRFSPPCMFWKLRRDRAVVSWIWFRSGAAIGWRRGFMGDGVVLGKGGFGNMYI